MKFRVEFLENDPQLMILHLDCEFEIQESGKFEWPTNEGMPLLIRNLLEIKGILRVVCNDRCILNFKKSLAFPWDIILEKIMEKLLLNLDPTGTVEELAPPLIRLIDKNGYYQLKPSDEKHRLRTFSIVNKKDKGKKG